LLAFLAYGAPFKDPSPSLYINRDSKIGNRRKNPINPSQVCDLTESKKKKACVELVDSSSDFDNDITLSLKAITKPRAKNNFSIYKADIKAIKKEDDKKTISYVKSTSSKNKINDIKGNSISTFSTPINVQESELVKAKKALDDYSSAYKLISEGTFDLADEEMLESMKRTVQNQAKYYFSLIKIEQQKLFPESALSKKIKEEDESSIASFSSN